MQTIDIYTPKRDEDTTLADLSALAAAIASALLRAREHIDWSSIAERYHRVIDRLTVPGA